MGAEQSANGHSAAHGDADHAARGRGRCCDGNGAGAKDGNAHERCQPDEHALILGLRALEGDDGLGDAVGRTGHILLDLVEGLLVLRHALLHHRRQLLHVHRRLLDLQEHEALLLPLPGIILPAPGLQPGRRQPPEEERALGAGHGERWVALELPRKLPLRRHHPHRILGVFEILRWPQELGDCCRGARVATASLMAVWGRTRWPPGHL
mmetsp:Transcript_38625/g.104597  ORF Transcript_38625/g.104597 Transcript_38625/m.104597 type:complete len:209 (-) Transcript_38625:143-769(-)